MTIVNGIILGFALSVGLMGTYPMNNPGSPLMKAVRKVSALVDPASNATPLLRYFDARGRAEAIRLACADRGVELAEETFTGAEWGKGKPDGLKAKLMKENKLAFGQVPLLEIDGLNLVQSHTILR